MPYPFLLDSLLVGAPQNAELRVTHILFDRIREQCAAHGVHEGDHLRCLAATPSHLVVEHADGGVVNLPLGLSTCVHVELERAPAGIAALC